MGVWIKGGKGRVQPGIHSSLHFSSFLSSSMFHALLQGVCHPPSLHPLSGVKLKLRPPSPSPATQVC